MTKRADLTPTLAPDDRTRLAMFLGMLGSDHSGEIENAGRMADKLVRARGLTWFDVVQPIIQAPIPHTKPPPPRPPPDETRSDDNVLAHWPARWRDALRLCTARHNAPRLTEWERTFLASLDRYTYPRRPSNKQIDVLRGIVLKVIP